MLPKVNYVNNVDLLAEIHKSKCSYCSFTHPDYSQHDIIITDISDITQEKIIDSAITARARRLTLKELDFRKKQSPDAKIKMADCEYDKSLINKIDLVFRIMTFDHIPLNNTRKKNQKTISDGRDRVNFPPFQHWKYDEQDNLICVGKSHWKGDMDTGEFSITHGKITDKLANMYMKMCDRYSTRGNVRSYCVDEETEALTHRGWLGIDDINEDDIIMSCDKGMLKWSTMSSIYKGEYEGLMHKMVGKDIDALVTPNHKMLTTRGLKRVEDLTNNNSLVLMGKLGGIQLEHHNKMDSIDAIMSMYTNLGNYKVPVRVSDINLHGGMTENGVVPTTYYKGRVWCPSTEYGCFLARRNGQVYLTGNSYVDEMRNQSLLQLVKIGLQFDESKSDNPFSYFSTVIGNGFCRVINVEKRNQVIRDELLELHGLSPSFTRTSDHEHEHAMAREHLFQQENHE